MKGNEKSPQKIEIDTPVFFALVDRVAEYLDRKFQNSNAVTKKSDSISDWISVKESMRLLCVGRTRLQQLKNEGMIRFFQDKKKLRFSRKSIEKYLNDHSS